MVQNREHLLCEIASETGYKYTTLQNLVKRLSYITDHVILSDTDSLSYPQLNLLLTVWHLIKDLPDLDHLSDRIIISSYFAAMCLVYGSEMISEGLQYLRKFKSTISIANKFEEWRSIFYPNGIEMISDAFDLDPLDQVQLETWIQDSKLQNLCSQMDQEELEKIMAWLLSYNGNLRSIISVEERSWSNYDSDSDSDF